jgi:hypothetical protein
LPADYGSLASTGNSVNLAYDTSLISGGSPYGWGPTCFRHEIGAASADGGTYYYETHQSDHGAKFTAGLRAWFDVIIESSSMADESGISLLVNKAYHVSEDFNNDPATPLCYRLYLRRSVATGGYKFYFVIDQDADEVISAWPSAGLSLTLGRVYRQRIEYDVQNKRIRWWVDETKVYDEDMSATNPTDVTSITFGSSGSSDGRSTVWLTDRFGWGPIATHVRKPLRPRIFGPGLAR